MPHRPPSILVIDDDPFLASTMALHLKRKFPPGTLIKTANTLMEARSLLAEMRFHAVISDHELPDGRGMDLIRSLLLQRSHPMVLFLISGVDPDTTDIAKLLREHREVTFIEKPFRFEEVAKRIRDAVLPETGRESSFYGLRLFDLIQAYSLSRLSMTIRVLLPDGKMGVVAVRDGDLIHAAAGGVEGQEALLYMARLKAGEIRVEEGCFTSKQSITRPTQQILIDTFRILDEEQAPTQPCPKPDDAPEDLDDLFNQAFETPPKTSHP